MNKKILIGILAGAVVLIAICITQIAPIQRRIFRENTDAVERVVLEFGEKMKNVSLQSPKEIVEKDLKENYSGLVTDELLAQWLSDFSQAPGKITSSPYPKRIKIQEIRRINLWRKYEVSGKVIEITSIQEVHGGMANEYNIDMIVEKRNGKWLIAEYKNLNLSETADWQVYKKRSRGFYF